MDNFGIVNIYGHIPNKSEIVIGVGNYNNVHGLLAYFPIENLLQIRPLPEIIIPSVIELILTYENPSSVNNNDNRVYFSLAIKNNYHLKSKQNNTNQDKFNQTYINVNIEQEGDKKIACACISTEKAYFWIDYSSIDKKPRSKLLAGALYSLQTTFGEQNYVVSWKIQGFSNGDLIIFLPTKWYEPNHNISNNTTQENFCQSESGVITLTERLNQIKFKGYTTQQWCEDVSFVTHCIDDEQCGKCLGPCRDPNQICYANFNSTGDKFICGVPNKEPKLNQSLLVSFTESPVQTMGTFATWLAIIAIVIIVIVLTWGLSKKNN